MLVQSANDMAITIAEGVSGTVENFVTLMNDAAREIGMKETHFANPNGLYAPNQFTSARDLARVVQRILSEFPEQRAYFSIGGIDTSVGYRSNTNGLIGRYPGADGMKTGFICPSGFNLVSTALQRGRRLVAVVLGAESGAMRVKRSARLLDYGFGGATGTGKRLEDLTPSSVTTPPDLRAKVCSHDLGETTMDDMPSPSMTTKLTERNFASVLPVAFGPTGKSAYAPIARNIGMPDLPISTLPSATTTGGKSKAKDGKAIMTASINQDERDQTEVSTFGMEPLMLTTGVNIGIPGFFQ
jgi:D-alanyl-D-alanine carboxypeptidase